MKDQRVWQAHVQQVQDDVFLHRKQRHTEQSQNQQLHRADFAEEGAVGNQRAGNAEVCVDEAEGGREENKNRALAERSQAKPALAEAKNGKVGVLFTLQKMRKGKYSV